MRRLALAVLLLATACSPWHGRWSDEMGEPGRVESKMFMPSGHGEGMSVGITSSGHTSIGPTFVDIPARYGVVLHCQHGSFAVEGEKDSRAFATWARVQQGDEVTIFYREYQEENEQTHDHRVSALHFERAVPR